MARVTVEDCIEVIPNRYELVVLAAQRAKDIIAGSPLTVERDRDKESVISLREIAEKSVNFDSLKEEIVESYSTVHAFEKIGHKSNITDEEVEAELEEVQQMSHDRSGKSGMSFVDENIEVDD